MNYIFYLVLSLFSIGDNCYSPMEAYQDALKEHSYFTYHKIKKQYEYMERYYYLAKQLEINNGIPIYLTFAQALHESGCGTSNLGINNNNHFGVKCSNGYCKYKSVEECYLERGKFFDKHFSQIKYIDRNDYVKVCNSIKGYGGSNNHIRILEIVKTYHLYKIK